MAASSGVKARDGAGVITGVRHFLLYEQDSNRAAGGGGGGSGGAPTTSTGNGTDPTNSTSTVTRRDTSSSTEVYSYNADNKTLHEVYMWPWGDAINVGCMAVMCAMPRVNDTHSCENNELLSGKLKAELVFPGFVYPDESAQFASYNSAKAGLDYSPYSDGSWTQTTLSEGISNGSLPAARLNDMAVRAVLPYYFVGLDTANMPATATGYATAQLNKTMRKTHGELIRKIGGEAIALLKNDNTNGGGLPLNIPDSISLFGSHAGPAKAGPNFA